MPKIAQKRNTKFRLEIPVSAKFLASDPEQHGKLLYAFMASECEKRRTPPALVKRMRVVFVGGLKAAQKAGQIRFLKGISADQLLVVYEADVADLDQF